MRAIDVDALIEKHYDHCNNHHGDADVFYTWSLELMRDAPTIEKVGRWEEKQVKDDDCPWTRRRFYCSACGSWNTYGLSKYCPDCGAKMDGERKESD